MSEKVKPDHTTREAILYVRQSSSFQVLHNQESRRLQYRMKDRLIDLGWDKVEIIDDDLGKSAGGTAERSGFQRMVAQVCLGRVGVVAARELSRFARNSRDWQQLVEVCRIVDTLLVDEEAVYDARESNDRLLLGLKGSLNEYELDVLRQRAQTARRAKAARGELGMNAPVGYVNSGEGRLEKDPDQRVQQCIRTVFEKFLELGTARQVLMWFVDAGLELPSIRWQDGGWQTFWRAPTYHPIRRFLKHPAYAGAYAWGKTRTETVLEDGRPRRVSQVKAQEEWLVLHKDHHEGYIDWDVYERIQEMIRKNSQVCRSVTPGAARRGPAMLAGLIRCRRCGKKLIVRYMGGGERSVLRYLCHRGFDESGEARCIGFGGAPVDDAVVREVMRVIEPAAVEAALLAAEGAIEEQGQALEALELEREARLYEAERARRQYDAAEPENRLVAAELERRWNLALDRVQDLDQRIAEERARQDGRAKPTADEFRKLAEDMGAVWENPRTDIRLKKRIIRVLIEEVVADVDAAEGEILLVVHWKGGVHTGLRVRRRRAGETRHSVPKDVVAAVRALARMCSDADIAGWLTRNGLRTGKGNSWTRQHVTSLRHRHSIPVQDPKTQQSEGWMNLSEAAEYLGVNRMALSRAVQQEKIPAKRPLPIGPLLLKRDDLDAKAAQQLAARVNRRRMPQGKQVSDDVTPSLFNDS